MLDELDALGDARVLPRGQPAGPLPRNAAGFGGSSLMVILIATGILTNIARHPIARTASRDITIVNKKDGVTVGLKGSNSEPVIYTFRLAHQ